MANAWETPIVLDGSDAGTMATTTHTVAVGHKTPITAQLTSTNGSRAIAFSTDGGVKFFTPAYAVTDTDYIIAVASAPISHVKFTGAIADTWRVL